MDILKIIEKLINEEQEELNLIKIKPSIYIIDDDSNKIYEEIKKITKDKEDNQQVIEFINNEIITARIKNIYLSSKIKKMN